MFINYYSLCLNVNLQYNNNIERLCHCALLIFVLTSTVLIFECNFFIVSLYMCCKVIRNNNVIIIMYLINSLSFCHCMCVVIVCNPMPGDYRALSLSLMLLL